MKNALFQYSLFENYIYFMYEFFNRTFYCDITANYMCVKILTFQ